MIRYIYDSLEGVLIKGIIFDMDGVLVDSESYYFEAFIKIIEKDGGKVDRDSFKKIVGKSHEDSLAMVGEYYDENFSGEEFLEKFEELYRNEGFTFKELIFPYVKPLLKKLKNDGYKIGLASSSMKDVILRAVEDCGIKEYFQVISSGEDFIESKPNPEIYLTTAEKMGLRPEECIAVEDSFSGIKSGKRAGMKVIAKKDTEFDINQEEADFIIRDMMMIPDIIKLIDREDEYEYRIFEYGSKLYLKSLFLRNNGLRKEFGLNIFTEDLNHEKDNIHLAILKEDEIIAYISISEENEYRARINAVVVDEKMRGNGIGSNILDIAEIIGRNIGYKELFLKARENKVGFYEKSGYKIISEGYVLEPTGLIHYDMLKN